VAKEPAANDYLYATRRSSSEDVLDFRSHFLFYLINIKMKNPAQRENWILVKEKKQ
jgi:hypothetical protein